MFDEMNGMKSIESVSEECFHECDTTQDAHGPTSLTDDDIHEASRSRAKSGCCKEQKKTCRCENEPIDPLHVHEVQGLIESAQQGADAHVHRFLVVSSDPKPLGKNDHIHEVIFCTDFHDGFCHEGWCTTSGAFPVGDSHVHFLEGITTTDKGHWHKYRLATSLDGTFG